MVRADKKLAGLSAKSVLGRSKESRFAAGVDREQLSTCQELGLELGEFIELGLTAMRDIAAALGL